MKTLVIHPDDYSTSFLSEIYKDKDWTIISGRVSNSALRTALREHDRIIMMGHGCALGLFDSSYHSIIDSSDVQILREKHCIGIWCNADQFFEKYKLKGLYTGMIISEISEAVDCCVTTTAEDIIKSNKLFAKSMKLGISDDGFDYDKIVESYQGDSPTIEFNKCRIYKI